jgi:hypothetical protein
MATPDFFESSMGMLVSWVDLVGFQSAQIGSSCDSENITKRQWFLYFSHPLFDKKNMTSGYFRTEFQSAVVEFFVIEAIAAPSRCAKSMIYILEHDLEVSKSWGYYQIIYFHRIFQSTMAFLSRFQGPSNFEPSIAARLPLRWRRCPVEKWETWTYEVNM